MKRPIRRFATCIAVLATLNLAVLAGRAAEPTLGTPAGFTPRIVATRGALTPSEIAKFQMRSAQARHATHDKAAGASDKKTVWIVVGVIVVAGVVALAAGGGGGGGGGGGY